MMSSSSSTGQQGGALLPGLLQQQDVLQEGGVSTRGRSLGAWGRGLGAVPVMTRP